MASERSKRRSTRQAASRKRSIYAEPDTDDDFEIEGGAEAQFEELPLRNVKRRKAARSRPRTRSKAISQARPRPRSKKTDIWVLGKPRKAKTAGAGKHHQFNGPSDQHVPPWGTLPINILREIFSYTLYSGQDSIKTPRYGSFLCSSIEALTKVSERVTWLMKVARTCRAFALPALEAYYESPILTTLAQPHDLIYWLEAPNDSRFMDYNVKIRSLRLDVQMLAYTATNRGHIDLGRLVAQMPQLQHIEIRNPRNEPPFRPAPLQKWYYPPSLFEALREQGIRLKSWRWVREMIAEQHPTPLYESIVRVHSSQTFESLERLVICDFHAVDTAEALLQEQPESAGSASLANAIAILPNLKDLTFITCEIVVEKFLEYLPAGLERLELTNCLELTSDMLVAYFSKYGSSLRQLELNHNPALNMAYLTSLQTGCPRLETLRMDLRYYSERENSNDAEALYDELLGSHDIPTWPLTLRNLELVHLQRLSQAAAEHLFTSLLDNAKILSDLRCLTLHAHIDIPWRDRAGFRDLWIGRIVRVFLCSQNEPMHHLGSLRQFRLWKEARAEPVVKKIVKVVIPILPTSTQNIAVSAPRRSQRVIHHAVQQTSASMSTTSTSPTLSSLESDTDNTEDELGQGYFVQGLCRLVDVRIDNQRPRENQFTEGDFLDSEASGDEDWHEGADREPNGRYAW